LPHLAHPFGDDADAIHARRFRRVDHADGRSVSELRIAGDEQRLVAPARVDRLQPRLEIVERDIP